MNIHNKRIRNMQIYIIMQIRYVILSMNQLRCIFKTIRRFLNFLRNILLKINFKIQFQENLEILESSLGNQNNKFSKTRNYNLSILFWTLNE